MASMARSTFCPTSTLVMSSSSTPVSYTHLGLAFNRRHQIWDYQRMPANLRGQICLPFTLAWCGLSALALGGMRMLKP